jgi:histidinol-phosphate phosphatase family protein
MNNKQIDTVFLDKDGVINMDSPDYIKSWEEVVFIDGSLEAIRLLAQNDFQIFLITNQSMINRGMVPVAHLEYMFAMMKQEALAAGGRITDIFYCPHTPEDGCRCRKPLPGLIRQAQQAYPIDMEKSFMVGDSARDIECGKNAGCGKTILVLTGNGPQARTDLAEKQIFPDHIAENLLDAAIWMTGSRNPV